MESNTEVAIVFIASGIFLLVLGLCIKVDENEEEDYYKKYKKYHLQHKKRDKLSEE